MTRANEDDRPEEELARVAIVGMAGRFPGAPDLGKFWEDLCAGRDALVHLGSSALRGAGVPAEELADPRYVRAARPLEGIDRFDAEFFGYAPGEAARLDPQQRLFLECAWNALEDAGHGDLADPTRPATAVFAGEALPTYLLEHLGSSCRPRAAVDDLVTQLGNEKDFLAVRAAYHLDLGGPALTVQTGCSSSLVAVAQAWHALVTHQCDVALAGGVAVRVPAERGYRFLPDGILSPDGRCRPYDAEGRGTSFGGGVGVVVLRRLEDALADGDPIRAVLLGAATNNDGARKTGFTSPSVDGQATCVAAALATAGARADEIDYVEGHGTATPLGDPVEVAALARVFAGVAPGGVALGSVKGNVGHLDAASGVCGLIKTVLALEHGALPPTAHFRRPNPACELEGGPLRVVAALEDWPRGARPRRAGVSSFGVGGTNAHVVLEEAPLGGARPRPAGPQLLVLSARTPEALAKRVASLAAFLEATPDVALPDVAHTLRVGRAAMRHRFAVVVDDVGEAVRSLRASEVGTDAEARPVRVHVHVDPGGPLDPAARFDALRAAALDRVRGLSSPWSAGGTGLGALVAASLDGTLAPGRARELAALPAERWPEEVVERSAPVDALVVRPRADEFAEPVHHLEELGRLWSSGADLDWSEALPGERGARVALPTYPFEARRHWFEPGTRTVEPVRDDDVAAWFRVRGWRRADDVRTPREELPGGPLLLLADDDTEHLAAVLRSKRPDACVVRSASAGAGFVEADGWSLDPADPSAWSRLWEALGPERLPATVVHLWLAGGEEFDDATTLVRAVHAPHHLVTTLVAAGRRSFDLALVVQGVADVAGDALRPARAAVLGPARVLPQENAGVRVRCVDLDRDAARTGAGLVAELARERPSDELLPVALRGGRRFVPVLEAARLERELATPPFRRGGTYVITGGLGGVGLALADHLAEAFGANLVLVGRRGGARRERAVEALEAKGARVLVAAADVCDRAELGRVLDVARARFGTLHGAIHAAGVPGVGIAGDGARAFGDALAAKVTGTRVLLEALGEVELVVLCSALATELGGPGQADYCAANQVLDAHARAARGGSTRVVSIGWDVWSEAGMAVDAVVPRGLEPRRAAVLRDGLSRRDGVEVLRRVLASSLEHVLVSTVPLEARLAGAVAPARPADRDESRESAPRATSSESVEEEVRAAWLQLLGVTAARSDESFFDQGGNSLLAAQLLGRFENAYPRADISLRGFFEDPTIGGLVRAIEAVGGGTSASRSPLEELREASGTDERRAALTAYLRAEVAGATGVADAGLDAALGTELAAAHVTAAVQRDLGLALYPHDVRASTTVEGLARLVEAESTRLGHARPDASHAGGPSVVPSEPGPRAGAPMGPAGGWSRIAFVLSAPRSGSTLLRAMLSAHPGLFCPPELFLLDQESMRGWDRDPFAEFYRDGLVRAFMTLDGTDYAAASRRVDDLVARDASTREVYRALTDGPHVLVDKTPTYALDPESLARAERWFDAPRHVLLVRHPLATMDSFVRNRIDRVRRVEGDSHELAERNWTESYSNLRTLRAAVGPERTHLVRYEDLLADQAGTLAGVCAFLGVPFDEAVLDPYGRGRMLGGPGDPHLFRRGAVDVARKDAWRDVRWPRELGDTCRELAAELGYDLDR